MVGLAAGFKLFDALLLGLPVLHGAVGNPVFAIVVEGAAFALIVSVVSRSVTAKAAGQGLAGGLAALVAVNLFPLVKFATGVAPCVTGTAYPLSLYYAPIAVALRPSRSRWACGRRGPGRARDAPGAPALALARRGGPVPRRPGPAPASLGRPREGGSDGKEEQRGSPGGVSRRDFIEGMGTGALGTAVIPELLRTVDRDQEGPPPGYERKSIALTVNGRRVGLEVEANETLLEVLRDKLDLTGAKKVCDRGECGGGQLPRDGAPVHALDYPAVSC